MRWSGRSDDEGLTDAARCRSRTFAPARLNWNTALRRRWLGVTAAVDKLFTHWNWGLLHDSLENAVEYLNGALRRLSVVHHSILPLAEALLGDERGDPIRESKPTCENVDHLPVSC